MLRADDRYYEAIGLIPNAARTDGGRRSYGWPDVKRLQFIRRARDFGMSIDQIGNCWLSRPMLPEAASRLAISFSSALTRSRNGGWNLPASSPRSMPWPGAAM
jgi:DNA-binding transcriptional MerR regulator